jgi:hypothetical protein
MYVEEAAMSAEVDPILGGLDEGVPKLPEQMDEMQARLRRPVAL